MRPVSFRPDIEGLRGVAILLVVAYHVGLSMVPGGYVGVDIFFVLSGFLITGLLSRELDETDRVDFAEFYARRARRLLPAAALVLVCTLGLGSWLLPPVEQLQYAGTAIATAAYVSNFWFAKESTDYLAPDSHFNPLLHTWSLSVEEQFYLIWPCALVIVAIVGSRHRRQARLRLAMLTVFVLSLATSLWLTRNQQSQAFFGSPTRAWEFAAGGVATVLVPSGGLPALVPWLGAGAVLLASLVFTETTLYPGVAALLPVVGTAVLLMADPASRLSALLSARWLQAIGRVSYSWYLWHWPVLVFGQMVFGSQSLTIRLLLAALSLVLAFMTLVLVENPVRRSASLAKFPRRSLALTFAITVLVVSVSWLARARSRVAADDPAQNVYTQAANDVPILYSRGCHLLWQETVPKLCEFGDLKSETVVVLFGDSHAAQWLTALERIAVERKLKIVSITKSACPVAAVEPFDLVLNRGYRECTEWRSAAMRWIRRQRPSAVIASSATNIYLLESSRRRPTADEWNRGLRVSLRELADADIPTLLIRDTPYPEFDIPLCLARASWNRVAFGSDCSFSRRSNASDAAYAMELAAIDETPPSVSLDLTADICPEAVDGGCPSFRQGLVLYRDDNHLTTAFSTSLSPAIAVKLGMMKVF